MYTVKQSTALTIPIFVHDVNGDAVTGLVDAGFTKRISKGSGAFAAMTVTITELENGWYSVPLTTTHANTLGLLSLTFTHGSAKQVNLQLRVEAKLTDDLNDIAATAIVSGGAINTTGGAVDDVTLVATTTTNTDMVGTDNALLAASINLTAGAVDNVTTVATTTTNTDMRGTNSALLAANINLTAGAVDNVTLVATATNVTNQVTADMTAISGDTIAADNLELQYDTTGLTGDTFPATQSQLSNIASVGAATNVAAESYVLTTGTQSANTVSDTAPLDGVRHEHTDTAGVMDLYYQFDVGIHGVPTSAIMTGYLNGKNDQIGVYAYNWVGASWDQVDTIQGADVTTDTSYPFALYTSHVGTGANLGKVRIRFFEASGLTTATLAVDQIYTSYATIPEVLHVEGSVNDVTPTTTNFDTTLTDATGFWDDALLTFISGALEGQSRVITSYSVTNGNISLDEATTSAVADGDDFVITYSHIHSVTQIQAGLATEAKQDIIDTNVDAILVDTSTTIPGTITTLQSDTDDIQTRLPATLIGGRMDSDVEAINNNTTAADNLAASALGIVATTVNDAAATTTSFVITSTEATNNHFKGRIIVFTSGALKDQATDITAYTGASKTVTVTVLTEAPADTDTFVIV